MYITKLLLLFYFAKQYDKTYAVFFFFCEGFRYIVRNELCPRQAFTMPTSGLFAVLLHLIYTCISVGNFPGIVKYVYAYDRNLYFQVAVFFFFFAILIYYFEKWRNLHFSRVCKKKRENLYIVQRTSLICCSSLASKTSK